MTLSEAMEPDVLRDATPEQLVQAAACNHRELFRLAALANGGEVREADGVTWTHAHAAGASMVAFPTLADERAGAQLDEIVAYFLAHGSGMVGCWSLDPPQPADLGVRLLARGFQPGWRPCWMALDLREVRTGHPTPEGLAIHADGRSTRGVPELPYADRSGGNETVAHRFPDRFARFVATLGGAVVAHSGVLLTTGEHGVAGIYDVGVVPACTNRGIGKAVTLAACLHARELGYRYAVLNATGRRMYEQLGFRWMGDGWTWWLKVPRVAANPPSARQVAIAEAVGRGDLEALDDAGSRTSRDDLTIPMANGLTLMELAGHLGRPESARWLEGRGVPLLPLEAWDLGWRDRAAELLREDPGLVDRRYGEGGLTLLHKAAERGDAELAMLALSAAPDLEAKDEQYGGTPLGWARYTGRGEIARLIEEHAGLTPARDD
jgi:ribosomal protein S18 acetylase RimI-like enzyme